MMSVRLIGMTQPLPEPGEWIDRGSESASEHLLAYCARVSNAANQGNHATGAKLLKRLVKHAEWSPFEMVSLTMEIVTTRDIARQMLRHRSFSFQEFSQRYAQASDEAVFRDARDQHPTDRQSSIHVDKPSAQQDWRWAQARVWEAAQSAYKAALSRGMAKEVARVLLPEGMTQSRLYMAGTLRSWFHYIQLRSTNGTQLEHREIAQACREIVNQHFPVLRDLWDDPQQSKSA